MKKTAVILFIFFSLILDLQAQQNTLTQYSTINALIKGVYDGDMTLETLKSKGNFGIGTFNTLDGEMVFLDNIFYRVEGSGKVVVADPESKTPFAAVTFFKADLTVDVPAGKTMTALTAIIDSLIPTKNIFYAVKISGNFSIVKTRSVPAQKPPYKLLTEIVKTQPVFTFDNAEGVVMGFRCPPYVSGVNVPGYHLHFLKSDHQGGGHVLDFTTGKIKIEIEQINYFSMSLPENQAFNAVDLNSSSEKDIRKVEK